MTKVHWVGTGLSAVPGIRRLIENGHDVVVWNRSYDKAVAAVGDITEQIRAFTMPKITESLHKGDILVSMLPGDWHVPLAELCLSKDAHFVSSSYISPEMAALDLPAKQAGLTLINEVGLDPGIDHAMAHWLVADYRSSAGFDATNALSFISYCGGIPKTPNPFKYKFSWSPLGVLKALRSPSKSIDNFKELNVARPWDAISSYDAPLATPETFEVYPNRDSLPFMADYRFDPEWPVKKFVRGTLRLKGWADAWADVFTEVETLTGAAGDARLQEMSEQFWAENAYGENDFDRVVMFVALKAEKDGKTLYHKTYAMDAWGDARSTAMARLVSIPVSLAVEAVKQGDIAPGVSAVPNRSHLVARWMETVADIAQELDIRDHLQT